MERVLGLDLGTNSLGWAIINRASRLGGEESQLLERGTLLFQEGVDIDKGVESSKAAKRTSYRALRRHYFRRKLETVI